ncbi:hypothetical protein KC906_00050, partial [Candidatus Kaiserbacteria bacterium]|nr:hypothetical protein [Candidatus Kaiserbacteria bacterium]
EVARQIELDVDKFELNVASEKLQTLWNSLNNDSVEGDSLYAKDYICVVTMYGPRGFFYTPNTIYVNVTFDSERDWVQTMLHEMLHLAHFEETKELAHAEREGFIDKKFIELWGDTFPEYSKQKISK